VGAPVVAGLAFGVIAAVLALTLNWLQRPKWATTGRLIIIVIVCIALGALAPLVVSHRALSVDDVAGTWTTSSSVSNFTTDVVLTIRKDATFDFAMTVTVNNPPFNGSENVKCAGVASPDGDKVALEATSGSCPGLTVKPGHTRQTLNITGSNSEPIGGL
jgi:hypothetical protein